jgi:hypothetical protein
MSDGNSMNNKCGSRFVAKGDFTKSFITRGRRNRGCGLAAGFSTTASRKAFIRMIDSAGTVMDSDVKLGGKKGKL